jgi:hypothetical protein
MRDAEIGGRLAVGAPLWLRRALRGYGCVESRAARSALHWLGFTVRTPLYMIALITPLRCCNSLDQLAESKGNPSHWDAERAPRLSTQAKTLGARYML